MNRLTNNSSESILQLPQGDRPREKLLQHGAEYVSDAELLAIILRSGVRGKSALQISRELINKYQGIKGVFECEKHTLLSYPGVGLAKYAEIKACLELARRYFQGTSKRGPTFSSCHDSRAFIQARMHGHKQEIFACLFLDAKHRLISFEPMFQGTVDCANVYPREVVRRSLHHNAAALIVTHNHPSGIADPSQSDIALTKQLQKALALIDVILLDHIIVGESVSISLAQLGHI